MEKKDYEDFVLRIRRDREGYLAIPSSPSEEGTGEPFASPFEEGEIEDLRVFRGCGSRDLDPPKKTARSRAREVGQRLFERVFSGSVWKLWVSALAGARHAGHGLRLRLILESPELWEWPWEYLREPGHDFLIFSRDISIARSPGISEIVPPLQIKLPLRVLVVIAKPGGSADLDSEAELRELKKSLEGLERSGHVKLTQVESASLATLRQDLDTPIHVLHFIGHGGFDQSLEQAFLQFEKPDGEPDLVTGVDLARILGRQSPPVLIVLNACEGGRASKADPFGGVAQALLRNGTSAVVAMQFRVTDEAALTFSKEFYKALASGDTVDHAVYEARLALHTKGPLDWGNPVLYLRGSQGRIFEVPEKRPRIPHRIAAVGGAILLVTLSVGGYFLSRRPTAPDLSALDLTNFGGPPRKSIGSSEGCPPIKDLDIVFKRIEPGTFMMGGHGEGMADAKPHQVTITRPFCISDTEITIMQWWRVLNERPSKFKKWWEQPVESVSWTRIQDFLQALKSWAPKATFRLPTEAQWEYAARAGSTTLYSFGNDPEELSKYGNCGGSDDHFDVPAPVGTFAPNKWGLFDMQGNVSEWVADWYEPYEMAPQTDPTGPERGAHRVRRGGSFSILGKNCIVAKRNKMKPNKARTDVGFRIVRDVEP